ncbi:hypothetical protein EVG20_g620 [Dentipellis fragilis]|uniref:Uncharacterized protein n=1 Tax=Dentipellis fragilis TaxID=205917 RepID=A0A4Y9ZD20_9AGAM|nr:hypothetical protein EVG20_g620 [Dentipellis fragilis]
METAPSGGLVAACIAILVLRAICHPTDYLLLRSVKGDYHPTTRLVDGRLRSPPCSGDRASEPQRQHAGPR